MKVRNYCFTSFKEITKDTYKNENVSYICFQQEKCPTTGKIHWQGYLELKNPSDLKNVKNIFKDSTIHLEPRRGSQKQAIDYCKKNDSKLGEFFFLVNPRGREQDQI